MSNAGAGAGAGAGGPAQPTPEEIKKLTNLLTELARADGIHDFTNDYGPVKDDPPIRNSAFEASVPGKSNEEWKETQSLNSVFEGTDIFRNRLENEINEKTNNGETAPPLKGIPIGNFTTKSNFTFKVKAVPFKGKPLERVHQGKELIDNLFEGKDDGNEYVILQVDFNHHGFLTSLRGNPTGPPVRKIGYMWSAATVNDPASKTDPSENVFKPGGEVEIQVHKQTSGTTTFVSGGYSRDNYTQNFMTNYNIELSEIHTKGIFGIKQKSSVSIKFQKGAQTATVNDSKGQNSKDQLKPFINKIVSKLSSQMSKDAKDKLEFELATKWMQKRSGDWLQALHAKMYRQLTFEPPVNPAVDPFFVSHDQIAIGYALMMGIPSLYFFTYPSGENRVDYIVVFDNRTESEQQRTARVKYCEAELSRSGVSTKIDDLWTWYQDLLDAQTKYMNARRDAIDADLALIDTPPSALQPIRFEFLEKTLRNILEEAMRYVFVETLIPTNIPNPNTQPDVCLQYNAYQSLSRLQQQHGGFAEDIHIPNNLIKRFEGTKVFKTLKDWTIEYTGSKGDNADRFKLTSGQNKPDDYRDRFAFLAYIANSRTAAFKNTLANSFKDTQTWFLDDEDTKAANIANLFFDREPTANRKLRVEKGIRDILTQGYIYLKTTEPTSIGEDDWRRVKRSIQTAVADVPLARLDEDTEPVVPFLRRVLLFFSRILGLASVPDRYGPGEQPGTTPIAPPANDEEDQEADIAPDFGERTQTGGWRLNGRPLDRQDLDMLQITDPPLHALVEAEAAGLLQVLEQGEDESPEALLARQIQRTAEAQAPSSGVTEEGIVPWQQRTPSIPPMEVESGSTSLKRGIDLTSAPSGPVETPAVRQRVSDEETLLAANWKYRSGAAGDIWTDPYGNQYEGTDAALEAYRTNNRMQTGQGREETGLLTSKGWTQQREGVWRDPATFLDYSEEVALGFQRARDMQKGGAGKDSIKEAPSEAVLNVLEPLLLMSAQQIVIDTDDMAEATSSQLDYYTRGVDLLTAISKWDDRTPELALATYELLCCSRFTTASEFMKALDIKNDYEAETLRLFFSGLESYSRVNPPKSPLKFLEVLKPLYSSSDVVKSTEEIREAAQAIIDSIINKYSVDKTTEESAEPVNVSQEPAEASNVKIKPDLTAGPSGEEPTDVLNTSLTRGPTQDPGALEKSFSTPERPSRQSGGKRRPLFTTP